MHVINFNETIFYCLREHVEVFQGRHCTYEYKVTLRRDPVTIVTVERAISITYSDHVPVAIVIRHVKRMRRVLLSSVTTILLHIIS